ncbi:hypothetical protein MKX08_009469 [Trichoderma sp. CBMAI-0020]|nr:hypothetical protein MKX08_009469 [Trichoderma sp. CBMAI-0020]
MTAISQGWDVDSAYAFETFAKVNARSEPSFINLAYVVLITFLVSVQLSEVRKERDRQICDDDLQGLEI